MPGTQTLDSIASYTASPEAPAERAARHLAILRRMTDLGLQLLERVAADALHTPKAPSEPAAKPAGNIVTYAHFALRAR